MKVFEIDAAFVQAAETAGDFGADAFDHFGADLLFAAGEMEIERAARRAGFRQQFGHADALIAARAEELDGGREHVFAGR